MALRRSRHLKTRTDIEIANQQNFKEAARYQRVCAVCGTGKSWDAHHVVAKSKLKRDGHFIWDTRNALRLCDEYAPKNCHGKHTGGEKKVPLSALTDDNISYAFEVLGPHAVDYLRRGYAGEDPRLGRALAEAEAEAAPHV